MDWFAHNAEYVWTSYILTALALSALAARIILRDRSNAKKLRQLKD